MHQKTNADRVVNNLRLLRGRGAESLHYLLSKNPILLAFLHYAFITYGMYNPTHGLVPEQLLVVGVGQRGGPGGRRSQILCARRGGGRLRPDVDGNVLLLAVLLLRLLGRAARHLRRGARTVSSGLLVRRGLEVHEKACKCCKLALLHQFRVQKTVEQQSKFKSALTGWLCTMVEITACPSRGPLTFWCTLAVMSTGPLSS